MKLLTLILPLFMLGCVSTYKAAHTGGTIMGYEESRIKPGFYRLKYQGKYGQSAPQIYQWFLLRGAELAKADGKTFFKVEEGQAGVTQRGGGLYASDFPHYEGNIVEVDSASANTFDADDLIKNTPRL